MYTISRYFVLLTTLTITASLVRTSHATELSFGCDLALANPPSKKVRIASLDRETFTTDHDDAIARSGANFIFVNHARYENFEDSRGAGYLRTPMDIHWHRRLEPLYKILEKMEPAERIRFENQIAISQDLVRSEIGPLTIEDFRKWYKIYEQNRITQKRGSRRLKPDWAKRLRSDLGFHQRLFFYDNKTGELLGGVIFTAVTNLRALYETYKPEAQGFKLESRAFAELIPRGVELGLSSLNYVPDANFFGQYSPMSAFEFKTSLGMHPSWHLGERLVKILNPDTLNRDYLIFEFKKDTLVAHHFTDHPRPLKLHSDFEVIVHDLRNGAGERDP